MYADFFGFRELPFNNTPDPRFFFPTPDHDEALASLIYAVTERKGFVLLTGEVGAGKTLITRMMLRHFGTRIVFANINHAVTCADDLMESICTEFELPVNSDTTGTQLVRTLHDFLLAQFAQNMPVVLVLDEAQNLSIEGFERLRMIGNLEADDAKLLQIAVVGQPELQQRFSSPELRQLRQRIFRSFHLPALGREATEQYIRHRLSVVRDDTESAFEWDAFEAIYRVSRGLPRIINTVCDNSLLSAYSADRRKIDGPFVESVIAQMMLPTDVPEGRAASYDRSHPSLRATPAARASSPPDHSPIPSVEPPAAPGGPRPQAAPPRPNGRRSEPVEAILRRVEIVETQLRNLPRVAEGASPAVSSGLEEKVLRTVQSELHPLQAAVDRGLRTQARRLDALEQNVSGLRNGTSSDLAKATAVHASLQPLIQRVQLLVDRADTRTRTLAKQEERFRTIGDTVKRVVADLNALLNRTAQAAAKARNAERDAQTAYERLFSQSRRSHLLADQLTQLAHREALQVPGDRRIVEPLAAEQSEDGVKVEPLAIVEPPAIVEPFAAEPTGALLDSRAACVSRAACGSVPGTPSSRHERDRIRDTLHTVRESLEELRGIARDPQLRVSAATVAAVDDLRPTTRLAHRVEGLLKLISGRSMPGDASANSSRQVSTPSA